MKPVLRSIVAGALAAGMTFSLAALAVDGAVIVVADDKYVIQGAGGNTYEITDMTIVAEELEPGDMVEYELVDGKVVGVKKK